MKFKLIGFFLGIFGVFAILSSANAQRVELLFDNNQLLKGGNHALQSGNYDRAKFYFEKALASRNLSINETRDVHNGLCVTYMSLKRFTEAIEQCEASLDIQSNKWEILNNLGTVYLVMGDYENAIRAYEKALRMKPKSEILHFNLDIAPQRQSGKQINQGIEKENQNWFSSSELVESGSNN